MKKLRLTLNGTVYEVTVEVLEDDEQYVTGSNTMSGLPSSPGAPRPRRAEPVASPAAARAPAPVHAHTAADGSAITAPLSGTVRKVLVQAGSTVEAKTQAFVLDAMKMDTYIYAPHHGTIQEVCVQIGDTVQVGTVLARYRAEG
ncbi:MAG: biotin/lipoyl-containing protein [Candidatus Latescibacteria bacterium]|nr:biotin/lipoyl-containing protein [Candidatus Latescibacterota bacterium]